MSDFDVQYVANLARIDLSEGEIASLQAEIEQVVGHVQQLQRIDVDGVEPTAHATLRTDVTADDEVGTCLERDRVLANAPDTTPEGLIRVPKVIEGQEDH